VTDKGLTKPVEEGQYEELVECMGHLFAVKDRQANTDDMFDPLKQTIELLKTYDQEMPEEVHLQLQVCAFAAFDFLWCTFHDRALVMP
jgi:dynein heavy chain